jgi:hypothetical protein
VMSETSPASPSDGSRTVLFTRLCVAITHLEARFQTWPPCAFSSLATTRSGHAHPLNAYASRHKRVIVAITSRKRTKHPLPLHPLINKHLRRSTALAAQHRIVMINRMNEIAAHRFVRGPNAKGQRWTAGGMGGGSRLLPNAIGAGGVPTEVPILIRAARTVQRWPADAFESLGATRCWAEQRPTHRAV